MHQLLTIPFWQPSLRYKLTPENWWDCSKFQKLNWRVGVQFVKRHNRRAPREPNATHWLFWRMRQWRLDIFSDSSNMVQILFCNEKVLHLISSENSMHGKFVFCGSITHRSPSWSVATLPKCGQVSILHVFQPPTISPPPQFSSNRSTIETHKACRQVLVWAPRSTVWVGILFAQLPNFTCHFTCNHRIQFCRGFQFIPLPCSLPLNLPHQQL